MMLKKKILVIVGNGLDLSMKIHTAYSDFLNSNEFKQIRTLNICKFLEAQKELYTWIDIENELAHYCQYLYKEEREGGNLDYEDKHYKGDYVMLCDQLKSYLIKSVKDLTVPSDSIPIKFLHYIYIQNNNEPINVISFNYTDTLERLSGRYTYDFMANVIHIHGSFKTNDDIVFGVGDNVNLQQRHSFLYKSFSKYRRTNKFYQLLNEAEIIVFFGYSLGDTDRQYFEDYLMSLTRDSLKNVDLVFYYHGNQSYEQIKWQLYNFTYRNLSLLEMKHKVKYINDMSYEDPF